MQLLFIREDIARYILPSVLEADNRSNRLRPLLATIYCLFSTFCKKRRTLSIASAVVVDYKVQASLGQKLADLFPFSEKYGGLPKKLALLPVLASITNSKEISFKIGREAVLPRAQQLRLVYYVIEYLIKNALRGKLTQALSFVFDYYKSLWVMEYTKSSNPPLTFLFTPSSLSSRPIWSYIRTEKSNSVFCFYSSNLATFVNGTISVPQAWHNNVWENVLFPDRYIQEALLALGWGGSLHCTTGLLFEVAPEKKAAKCRLLDSEKPSILFFDVQPFPESYYESGKFDFQFYREQYMMQILESICQVAAEKDWQVYFKSKRNRKSQTQSEKYNNCLQKWADNGRLTALSPNTPIDYLVDEVNCCIATPYTSAAIISADLGCPSVYYATQEIDQFFGGLQNHRDLDLIIGEAELVKFLSCHE